MQTSEIGYTVRKSFEGCLLYAYPDQRGIWTIGWGHTGPEVCKGLVWTQAQADAALIHDGAWADACVNRDVTCSISQAEFDALTDLVYNIGSGNFQHSTVLRDFDSGAPITKLIADFEAWDKAAGNTNAGLLRRRVAEVHLFNQAA
jgi:lysozyme